jgi:hypothetical protein
MRELKVNEIQEVNGGHPVIVAIVVVKVAQKLAPAARAAATAAAAFIAGAVGYDLGQS